MPSRHRVAIHFKGDVFAVRLKLENQPVQLRFDGESTWTRRLEGMVEGALDFVCEAVGLSGTECELLISVDGKAPVSRQGMLEDRFLRLEGSIEV